MALFRYLSAARQLWMQPQDAQLDVAVIRLPDDFLKGFSEVPLPFKAIAKPSWITRFIRPGVPVTLLAWLSGALDMNTKELYTAEGSIKEIPTSPILWTDHCTRPLKNVLLDIQIRPGNSGGPVYMASSRRTVVLGIASSGSTLRSEAGIVAADYLHALLQFASNQRP
jgi:hypothetical protein